MTDGEDILIADDPAAFAERVIRLLRSPDLRQRLSAGGRRLVAARYDWNEVGQTLNATLEAAAARRAA